MLWGSGVDGGGELGEERRGELVNISYLGYHILGMLKSGRRELWREGERVFT